MIGIIGVASVIIAIIAICYPIISNKRERLKKYYIIIKKKSSDLQPKDLLGEFRPFKELYYSRPTQDILLINCLTTRKNVLIIGPPLSGKTRAVYNALVNSNKSFYITIPRCTDIDLETFILPKHPKESIIVIDDLQRFVEQQNFDYLFRITIQNSLPIIATCRSGFEFNKVKNKMIEKGLSLENVFGEKISELEDISDVAAKEIAERAKIDWDTIQFNGTVGSVFMPLIEMEKRYNKCSAIEKKILQSIKYLYICGVYLENQIFPIDWIKKVTKTYEIEGKDYEWDCWFVDLKGKEFLRLVKNNVQSEEVYLENIIKQQENVSILDIFQEMLSIFSGIPEALILIGNKASNIGSINIEITQYEKISIKSYNEALKSYKIEKFPIGYAIIQNSLGVAYGRLAEIEDKENNCKRAIEAFREALKVYTIDKFPIDYAMTQNNLGSANKILASVEDTINNCKKAIMAFGEALKVYTINKFPIDYARAKNNLGTVYRVLAVEEDKENNCKRAIESLREALKIYTIDKFPIGYAMTQNNLGVAYRVLAEVEDKENNCKRAIEALREALKVYEIDKFPIGYAIVQNNLGNAYCILEKVKDKVNNCISAINAFQESLKVYTIGKFPIDYAGTQNNLGAAYLALAEAEDKVNNCKRALIFYNEALQIYRKEGLFKMCQLVERNIKRLNDFCCR